jgi:SAM-dependent methyltransferase
MSDGVSSANATAARCPVCGTGGPRRDPALAGRVAIERSDALLLCTSCGLGWIDPALVRPLLYEEGYFREYEALRSFQGGVDELPSHLIDRLLEFARLNGGHPGRLLEVGCGFGPFLAEAHARGWQVYGTDVSRWTARHIAERYGLRIEVGDITTVALPEQVDALHMNHTLEHLADPETALVRLHGALRPGGSAIIEVPNELASFYERVRWSLLRRAVRPLAAVNPHVFFFNPRALGILLTRTGFAIDEMYTERRNSDVASRLPFGPAIKRIVYAIERHWNAGPNIVARAHR